ncbi:MAG: DEAD/DEAH box helicase [Sporolactobacillus sp.]
MLEQWTEKLSAFLEIPRNEIGQIGGGKTKITGCVDVAMLQSLDRKDGVKSFITQYGQVIVDECHHLAAYSFEKIMRTFRAKYLLGLTATPLRKDGLHPIIEMQCGPIRYKVSEKQLAKVQTYRHLLVMRPTNFASETTDIQKLYREIAEDKGRNNLIFNDVLQALEQGRKPIIITERVAHVEQLAQRFDPFVKNVLVLTGRVSKKERSRQLKQLAEMSSADEFLVLATGKYIGEGFDEARLDTLFLTMPVSWKGILQQYVGRLHREHLNKTDVRVYDYVDGYVSVLKRMFAKRKKSYHAMGYVEAVKTADESEQMRLF